MAIKKVEHGKGYSWEMTTKVEGKVVRRRFRTKREAEDAYATIRVAAREGTFLSAADSRTTLDEYAIMFLAARRVRPSTLFSYETNYRNHISPVLGDRHMAKVTRQQIQALIRRAEDKGLAPSTVRGIYNLTAMLFRDGVFDGKLVKTPCFRISLPEITPRVLAVFRPEEVDRLRSAAKPEHQAIIEVAFGTGLRQAELLGLTVDRVDFLRRSVRVDQQMLTPPTGGVGPRLVPYTKTAAGRRTVPMPPFALEALSAHIAAYGLGPEGLLFAIRETPVGGGVPSTTASGKPTLLRAGLNIGYGMHAARHTYASLLIREGQHPRVIQARLGHKSIAETMDTYGHLFPESLDETALAIETALGRHLPKPAEASWLPVIR
ncbi:MAG: hypothetical protein QOE76_3365 [Frankiales bacterium]|jgi:integrase|nr:hypothetical protein [Frankiales bacterium]